MRQVVGEGLGDVVARLALAEMEDADGAGKQAEHANHGKPGEDREHERLGDLARNHGQPDGGDRKSESQQNHKANTSVARGDVSGGLGIAHRRVDIAHGPENTRFERSWPDIVMERSSPPMRPKGLP